jgi:ferredoxin
MPLPATQRDRATRRGHAVPLGVVAMSTLHGMRVEVNSELCQGHNRCYALAPELFDVDDYGNAVVIGDGSVPPELEDKARLALANCPEYAITITGDGS